MKYEIWIEGQEHKEVWIEGQEYVEAWALVNNEKTLIWKKTTSPYGDYYFVYPSIGYIISVDKNLTSYTIHYLYKLYPRYFAYYSSNYCEAVDLFDDRYWVLKGTYDYSTYKRRFFVSTNLQDFEDVTLGDGATENSVRNPQYPFEFGLSRARYYNEYYDESACNMQYITYDPENKTIINEYSNMHLRTVDGTSGYHYFGTSTSFVHRSIDGIVTMKYENYYKKETRYNDKGEAYTVSIPCYWESHTFLNKNGNFKEIGYANDGKYSSLVSSRILGSFQINELPSTFSSKGKIFIFYAESTARGYLFNYELVDEGTGIQGNYIYVTGKQVPFTEIDNQILIKYDDYNEAGIDMGYYDGQLVEMIQETKHDYIEVLSRRVSFYDEETLNHLSTTGYTISIVYGEYIFSSFDAGQPEYDGSIGGYPINQPKNAFLFGTNNKIDTIIVSSDKYLYIYSNKRWVKCENYDVKYRFIGEEEINTIKLRSLLSSGYYYYNILFYMEKGKLSYKYPRLKYSNLLLIFTEELMNPDSVQKAIKLY